MNWNPNGVHPYTYVKPRGKIMQKLLSLLAMGLALSIGVAHADEEKGKAPTAQQSRMTQCNADAKGKAGDERKKFMSECLKAKPASAAPKHTAQQEKMKTCNAEAKGMKGDERKKFMSECLRKK
jgi:hypothetical protein